MTPFATPQSQTPKLPTAGRKLFTSDDLAGEMDHHFLPGQYVHVEQWTKAQDSVDIAEYTTLEGYIYDGYDWEFMHIGQIDRDGDKPSEKRLSIALTGDEGIIVPTVAATGTMVIPDPSAPRVTYQVTARTPVLNGPSVTGYLTNDLGQESPYDVTKLRQAWIDMYHDETRRDGDLVERTAYRHEVLDGDGSLMGCVETSDGGQTWQARTWYSSDQQFDDVEGFRSTKSFMDNIELVYREAGGTGRWTKRTMIEVPLPFEIAA